MAFTKVVGPGIHTQSNINSHNIHSTGIITATRFDGPFTNLNVTGITTFTGDANFSGNVSIAGTLTYEDVKNVDSIGIVTARTGLVAPYADIDDFVDVGSNIQLGNAGVVTATLFNGTTGVFAPYADIDDFVDVGSNIQLGNAGVATATLFSGASQIGIQSAGTQIGAGITQLNFVGAGNTFKVTGTTVDVSISGNTGAGGTWSSYTAGIATTKSVGVNTNNLDDNDLVGVGNSFQGLYISNGMMITDNSLHGNHYIGTAFNGLMAGPVTIEGTLTIDGNYVVV